MPTSQSEARQIAVAPADVSQQDEYLAVLRALAPQLNADLDLNVNISTAAVGLSRSQRAALVAMLTPPPPPRTWTSTEDLYRAVFNIRRPSVAWTRRRDHAAPRGARPVRRTLHRDGTPFRALRPAERASLARTMRRLVERGLVRPALMKCGKPMTGAWVLTDAGRAAAIGLAASEAGAYSG